MSRYFSFAIVVTHPPTFVIDTLLLVSVKTYLILRIDSYYELKPNTLIQLIHICILTYLKILQSIIYGISGILVVSILYLIGYYHYDILCKLCKLAMKFRTNKNYLFIKK